MTVPYRKELFIERFEIWRQSSDRTVYGSAADKDSQSTGMSASICKVNRDYDKMKSREASKDM